MIKLSKTKLNTFIQCPWRYRIAYELGIKPLKSKPALVEGSALHQLVEAILIVGPEIAPQLWRLNQMFWQNHPLERCDYPEVGAYRKAQKICLAQAIFYSFELQQLEVVQSELYLEAPLVNPITQEVREDIKLNGYLDILDMVDGRQRVLDLKTASKTPSQDMAAMALELTLYAYLVAYPDLSPNMEPVPVAFLYLVRTKIPKLVWQQGLRHYQHFVELFHTCEGVAKAIEHGSFWKNPGMHCSWCDQRPLCQNDLDTALIQFGEDAVNRYYQSNVLDQEETIHS